MKKLRELQRHIAVMLIFALVFQMMSFGIKTASANSSVINGQDGTEYVVQHKILHEFNINDGDVTITYNSSSADSRNIITAKQGEVTITWGKDEVSSVVIRGNGTSTNKIIIGSNENNIIPKVYLVDLEWSGQISTYGYTNINILGSLTNYNNTSLFDITSTDQIPSLVGYDRGTNVTVKSIIPGSDSSKVYFYKLYLKNLDIVCNNISGASSSPANITAARVEIENCNITCTSNNKEFITPKESMTITNSTLNNAKIGTYNAPSMIFTATNSELYNTDFYLGIQSSYYGQLNFYNSVFTGSTYFDNSIGGKISKLYLNSSYVDLKTNEIITLEATASNLALSNSATTIINSAKFNRVSANSNNTALNTVVKDLTNNPLYFKIIRIKDYPNRYVSVSFDDGFPVIFKTDGHGYIYPYLSKGSTYANIILLDESKNETDKKFNVTYPEVIANSSTVHTATEDGSTGEDQSELIANLESQIALLTAQLAQANNDKSTLQAENDNLRSQIVTLNETITDLRNQITLLTNQLSDSNSNNDLLVAEIESLNNQIILLNNQIAQLESDLVIANNQKQALEVQITTLNSTVINLNNQITALNELLATSENENEELRGQVNTLTTQINALLGQIEVLQGELSTLQNENDSLKTQIADLVSENTSLLSQIANLQQLLDSANSTIEKLEEQVSNLTNEVESLENQLSSANQENNVLVGKVTDLETNLKNANDKILLLENKIAALELEKLENLENIDLLNKEILDLSTQITDMSKEILNLETELSTVKSERDLLEQTVSNLNNQIDGLNSQITTLTERIQNVDIENAELKNKILELEESIGSLTSRNENLQNELDILTQSNLALSTQVNILISQNTALQSEIDRLQDLLDKANMTIEELESRVEDLTDQVSKLENQLEMAINDKNTLQGENDSLKSQISNLNERVNSLEQTIEQLRAEGENSAELIISLNNTIKDLNTQINSLQNDLNDANTTITNLNNTIDNLNNNIVTLENELTRLSNKIVELEEENEDLKGKVADLITRVGELETEAVKLNNEIDTLKAEKEEYQSLLADAIASFKTLRNLLDSIKEELGIEDDKNIIPAIKELKDKLSEEIRKNESLQTVIKNITDNLDAARSENLILTGKLESIKDLVGASNTDEIVTKIEELLNTIEESNRKIAQLEQEKSTLITQLNEAVNTIQELLQKIEELQENFESSSEELELIISNLQKQIEELSKENVDLKSTLEQLRKDSNDLAIENQFLKSEIVRLESLLEEANSTIKELLEKLDLEVKKNESLQTIINNITDDLNAAKQENLTLIDKLDSLKELVGATDTEDIFTKIEELINTLEESNKKITQLEQEKNTLIEKLDDALSKIQDLLLKIEELQEIIDSSENELVKEISKLKDQIVDLSKENNDLKSALEKLNNDSNELAKENQFLKSEIIRLESLLDTANSTIKELRELVASLKVENELVKSENESLKEKLNNSNNPSSSNDGYYQEIIDSLKKEIEELKKGSIKIGDDSIILTPVKDDKVDSIIEENRNEIIEDKITSKPGWEITDNLENEWVKEIEISDVIKSEQQEEFTFYAREEEKPKEVYMVTVDINGQVFSPTFSIDKTIHLGYSYKMQLANANDAKITYISSNKKVATVSKDGVISSVKSGEAVIVGEVETEKEKYSFTINVTVKEGGSTLNLKDDIIQTTADAPVVVMYKLVGENRTTKIDVQSNIKDAVVSYISSDASVVMVDQNGVVYGKKKGNVTVTTVITNGDKLYTYVTKVRVTDGTVDTEKWTYLTQD